MPLPAPLEDAIRKLGQRLSAHEMNITPVVDLVALVAAADGTVDEDELALVREVIPALGVGVPADEAIHLVHRTLDVGRQRPVIERTRACARALRQCGGVEEGLRLALAVARASNGISPEERHVLDELGAFAGWAPERVQALVDEGG